jgi:hypothetical protein
VRGTEQRNSLQTTTNTCFETFYDFSLRHDLKQWLFLHKNIRPHYGNLMSLYSSKERRLTVLRGKDYRNDLCTLWWVWGKRFLRNRIDELRVPGTVLPPRFGFLSLTVTLHRRRGLFTLVSRSASQNWDLLFPPFGNFLSVQTINLLAMLLLGRGLWRNPLPELHVYFAIPCPKRFSNNVLVSLFSHTYSSESTRRLGEAFRRWRAWSTFGTWCLL